jgi:hypothetical protein
VQEEYAEPCREGKKATQIFAWLLKNIEGLQFPEALRQYWTGGWPIP